MHGTNEMSRRPAVVELSADLGVGHVRFHVPLDSVTDTGTDAGVAGLASHLEVEVDPSCRR